MCTKKEKALVLVVGVRISGEDYRFCGLTAGYPQPLYLEDAE